MGESRASRRGAARCVSLVLLLTTVLIVPATRAAAAWLVVDCIGHSGEFTSINDAINSLTGPPPVGQWDYIVLRSDCIESVKVTGGRRVWIAPEWATYPPTDRLARIAAPSDKATAVSVEGPSDVTLANLVLSNGRNGLNVEGHALVTTHGVSVEDNANAGIMVNSGAALNMNEGGAIRNGWYGIAVGLGASAALSGMEPWEGRRPLVVSGNVGGGIRVDRGFVYGYTGVTIENNSGPGLVAFAGVSAFGDYQALDDTSTVFQGNQGGAFVSEGSSVTFWSSVVLRGNGSYGVYVEDGGNATFMAFPNASGGSRTVTVEGHTAVGVEVVDHSQAAFHGHHVIRENGSGLSSGGVNAGIWVDGSSHVYFDNGTTNVVDTPPEVADNAGHGILVTVNSSIDARSGIVHGNLGSGIGVHYQSIGYLGPDSRLVGPAGANGVPLSCDSTSLVSTNLVRRSNDCTNVAAPFPRPQRPPMPK